MKRLILHRNKFRSKKGMSLVEILIGVAIIVIVFASTLGAMVSGYTTTVYNADENRAGLLNASVNDIVFTTIKRIRNTGALIDDGGISANDLVQQILNSDGSGDDYGTAITAAVEEKIPGAVFVPPTGNITTGFQPAFVSGVSFQYTLIPEVRNHVTTMGMAVDPEIPGIRLITSFESAQGTVMNESFIPYKES